MKTVQNCIGACLVSLGAFAFSQGVALGVALPYYDQFDVPPYVLYEPIAGQQGWVSNGTGDSPYAYVANDPTGSGRGTLLWLDGNTEGLRTSVGQLIDAPYSQQSMTVQFDIYGYLASTYFVMPWISIGDSATEYQSVFVEPMAAYGGAPGYFRLNGNSSIAVPNIEVKEHVWYTVTIDLFWEARTYNISVTDGVTTGQLSDVPFWYDSIGYPVSRNNMIWFRVPDNDGQFLNTGGYVDNLSIASVPEPSQILLLGLGGLVALTRLRKRQNS